MPTISLSLPVSGTVASAGQIATDLTTLQTLLNGGLDTANWASGLIFAPSKIMQEAAARQDGMVWNGSIWVPKAVASVYDRATTTVDVNTSVAETSIYTKSIAGGDMGTNKMLRATLIGDYLHNNVAGDALVTKVKFGGTTFYNISSAFGSVVGANRQPWRIEVLIANLGAANSQMIEGAIRTYAANSAAPTAGLGNAGAASSVGGELGISTLGTIDTSSAQTLDVTVQWSASSANNSWRLRYALLEIV